MSLINNDTIGLDNGLAPIRQQAILRSTNDGLIHWLMYAPFGPSEISRLLVRIFTHVCLCCTYEYMFSYIANNTLS